MAGNECKLSLPIPVKCIVFFWLSNVFLYFGVEETDSGKGLPELNMHH